MKWISVEERLPEAVGRYKVKAIYMGVRQKPETFECLCYTKPNPYHGNKIWSVGSGWEITHWAEPQEGRSDET